MRRHVLAVFIVGLALAARVPLAQAGGLEYAGGGTAALGRGGANAARADSPLVVLSKNPAGLAELRGFQAMFNAEYAKFDACVDPIGFYGWGAGSGYGTTELTDPETGRSQIIELSPSTGAPGEVAQAYYRDPYDTVCLDQADMPVPQLAMSIRLTERLGIGAGLIFPAIVPQGTWGSDNGVIQGNTDDLVEGDLGLRPAATRYMLVRSSNLGLFPTIGLGYRITDWLRIGAAFEWGMIAVNQVQVTPSETGLTPSRDTLSRISAEDFFIPAFQASLHLVPVDSIDFVVGFRYQDELNASGRLRPITGGYQPTLNEIESGRIAVTNINQGFPWKAWAALRFAGRLRPRPKGTGMDEGDGGPGSEPVHDAFNDERWDIEVDAVYEMNSKTVAQDVDFESGKGILFQNVDGTESLTEFPAEGATPPIYIRKGWNDQLSLRVGGSYNFVPGLFGVNLGAHYENRGVNPDFMQIDSWPVQRMGLHAGVTFRIAGSIDLSLAYAHIFQETITTAAGEHNPEAGVDKRIGVAAGRGAEREVLEEVPVSGADGTAALQQNVVRAPSEPLIINAGRYRSSLDVISAGVQMHF